MEYIRLLSVKLTGGRSGGYSIPHETELKIVFVAVVVILVVILFKAKNKS
jgi:hypothetical protein